MLFNDTRITMRENKLDMASPKMGSNHQATDMMEWPKQDTPQLEYELVGEGHHSIIEQ